MFRPRTLAAALALGTASTAALAVSGDAWYGTNRDYVRPAPVEEVTRVEIRPGVFEERRVVIERPAIERPSIVERTYVYEEPREVYVYRGHHDHHDLTYQLNPSTGHHIGRGLFPEKGPSDFGA